VPVNEDALLRAWTYSTCNTYGNLQNEDQALPIWSEMASNYSQLLNHDIPTYLGINITLPNVS
jgi:hypothetical protein